MGCHLQYGAWKSYGHLKQMCPGDLFSAYKVKKRLLVQLHHLLSCLKGAGIIFQEMFELSFTILHLEKLWPFEAKCPRDLLSAYKVKP